MNSELSQEEFKLITAIMDGSLSNVKKYVSKCDLKKVGILALRQALGWQDLEIAQYLLKKGIEPVHCLYHSSHEGVGFEVDHLLTLCRFSKTEMAQACGMAIINGHEKIIEKFFNKMPDLKQHKTYFFKIAQNNNPQILPFLKNEFFKNSFKTLH